MNTENKLPSGHTVQFLSEDDNERIHKHYPFIGNLIRLQPGRWYFDEYVLNALGHVYNFNFEHNDVIPIGHIKSGTNWMQEILWTFLHNPNLDNPMAAKSIDFRAPHFELDIHLSNEKTKKFTEDLDIWKYMKSINVVPEKENTLMLTYINTLPRPRVLKSHLPFSLLPPKILDTNKVVYMARNPRDLIISRYNFNILLKFINFQGTLDDFIDYYINDEVPFSPFWTHLYEAWSLRNHPNMLFLYFEDMVANPFAEYQKVNKFLNLNLPDKKVVDIVKYTSFSETKKRCDEGKTEQPMSNKGKMFNEDVRKKTGGYYRKGKVGDWKESFNSEQIKKINDWIKRSTKGFPENFPYLIKENE